MNIPIREARACKCLEKMLKTLRFALFERSIALLYSTSTPPIEGEDRGLENRMEKPLEIRDTGVEKKL